MGVTVGTVKKEFHLDAKFQPMPNPQAKAGHTPPSLTIKELKVTDLTAAIKSYLDTNYAGWVFVKGAIASVDATIIDFHLMIEVSSKKYIIEFDGNGAFKKAIAL